MYPQFGTIDSANFNTLYEHKIYWVKKKVVLHFEALFKPQITQQPMMTSRKPGRHGEMKANLIS